MVVSDEEFMITGLSHENDVLPRIIELSVSTGVIIEGTLFTMACTSGTLSMISSVPIDSDSLMMIVEFCCVVHPEELVDPEESSCVLHPEEPLVF